MYYLLGWLATVTSKSRRATVYSSRSVQDLQLWWACRYPIPNSKCHNTITYMDTLKKNVKKKNKWDCYGSAQSSFFKLTNIKANLYKVCPHPRMNSDCWRRYISFLSLFITFVYFLYRVLVWASSSINTSNLLGWMISRYINVCLTLSRLLLLVICINHCLFSSIDWLEVDELDLLNEGMNFIIEFIQ